MDTLTRARLAEAVWREVGLPRVESERLVEATIEALISALAAGERVTIVNFASFHTRAKRSRMARNPNTGEPAPVAARLSVVFRASRTLKEGVRKGVAAEAARGNRHPRREAF